MARKKLKLNLTDVKAGFDPVPPGNYPIEVVEAEIRVGQQSGRDFLWLRLRITEGEHNKRNLFLQHTLIPESLGLNITVESLNALYGEDISGTPDFELDCDALIGMTAIAQVNWEKDHEGEDKENVKGLKPFEEGSKEAIEKTEADETPW